MRVLGCVIAFICSPSSCCAFQISLSLFHFILLSFCSIPLVQSVFIRCFSFDSLYLLLSALLTSSFFVTSLLTSSHPISSLFISPLLCLVRRLFPAEAVECVSPYNFFGNEERITLQVAIILFIIIPIVPFVAICNRSSTSFCASSLPLSVCDFTLTCILLFVLFLSISCLLLYSF